MTKSSDPAKQDDAILQLMVEFRNIFLAQEDAPPEPAASPPPASRRRAGIVAVLVVSIAAALAYAGGMAWERSGALQRLVSSADGRAVAPRSVGQVPRSARPAKRAVPDAPAPEAPQPGAATPVVTPVAPVATSGTPVVTPSPAVVTVRATAVTPQPAPPATTSDGYHVQVGAFNVLEYARDMMQQLRAHDYSVTLVEAPTGPPHRVWIDGAFGQAAAARMVDRLRSDGFEAIVVRE